MKVELRGLQLFGYHGVEDEEQRLGQLFLYDVELEVGDRGADDRIDHAVDYSLVAAAVQEVNERRFDLLEALATAVADALVHRPTRLLSIGVPRRFIHGYGKADEHDRGLGLDITSIRERILAFLDD